MWRFISYFRHVRGLFFIDILFATLLAGASIATPYVTQLITKAALGHDFELLMTMVGMIVTIVVIRVIANFIITYWGHILGTVIEFRMRRDALHKMHSLKMSHYDQNSVGSYISRVVSDLKDIPEFAHHAPEDMFIGVVSIVGAMVYAFFQSWVIAVILLAIFIVGTVFITLLNHNWKKVHKKIREATSTLSAVIGQQVEAMSEIKSFGAQDFEQNRFAKDHAHYTKTWKHFYRFEGILSSTNMIIMLGTTTIVTIVGAFELYHQRIDMPQLIGLNAAGVLINQPMTKFAAMYTQITQGSSAVQRFYEFIDLEEETINQGQIAPMFKGLIEFKNVSFAYEVNGVQKQVLKDFNLTIQPGEKVSFVGPTGIGKSTILKLLLRFYQIQQGDITIDGVSIYAYNISSLRKQMGYIQQAPTIFHDTIKSNVLYTNLDATASEFAEAVANAQASDFIDELANKELTIAGPNGAQLSGGQKQRLSIARVFLAKTSIMLLDEATSALDNLTEKKVKDAIGKLTNGKTTLIVAHRLSTVKDSDRIIVLAAGGQIVEQGTYEQLIKKQGYLYNLEMQ